MMDINFSGHTFILHHDGIMIWPSEKIAVVSDLHLEKSSALAGTGQFLPPYDTFETLQKLWRALEFSGAQTIVFLGDSFHDNAAYDRLDDRTQAMFRAFFERYNIKWIIGNHDEIFIPSGAQPLSEWTYKSITFRHEATAEETAEISGHYHPKIALTIKGQKITRPCFAVSNTKVIMPAFGAYTGGMDIRTEPKLSEWFNGDDTADLLGNGRLYAHPLNK